jgi:flagellar biosynthesis/type III secretory pathway ATPase
MDRTMKSVVIAESSDAMPMLTNSAPQVTTEITKDFSYDWLLFVALLLITIFLFLLYLHKRRKV